MFCFQSVKNKSVFYHIICIRCNSSQYTSYTKESLNKFLEIIPLHQQNCWNCKIILHNASCEIIKEFD